MKVGLQNDFKRHTLLVKQSIQCISSIFCLSVHPVLPKFKSKSPGIF